MNAGRRVDVGRRLRQRTRSKGVVVDRSEGSCTNRPSCSRPPTAPSRDPHKYDKTGSNEYSDVFIVCNTTRTSIHSYFSGHEGQVRLLILFP